MSNRPDDRAIITPPQNQTEASKRAFGLIHPGGDDQKNPQHPIEEPGIGTHGRNGQSDKRFLTRPEAAAFLTAIGFPITKGTLMKYATTGGGPRFQKFGIRALYTPDDLVEWAEGKLSAPRRSTSDAA